MQELLFSQLLHQHTHVSALGEEKLSHFSRVSDEDMLSRLKLTKGPAVLSNWLHCLGNRLFSNSTFIDHYHVFKKQKYMKGRHDCEYHTGGAAFEGIIFVL